MIDDDSQLASKYARSTTLALLMVGVAVSLVSLQMTDAVSQVGQMGVDWADYQFAQGHRVLLTDKAKT